MVVLQAAAQLVGRTKVSAKAAVCSSAVAVVVKVLPKPRRLTVSAVAVVRQG